MNVVLASSSPRRAELLRAMGVTFTVVNPECEELSEGEPSHIVRVNAERKAHAAGVTQGSVVIGSDTLVYINQRVLGKPKSEADAACMLRELSGATHEVYTGLCVVRPDGSSRVSCTMTRVTFAAITTDEIERYVLTGDPMDKAGAYGIQGMARSFVERVEGNYDAVMGLDTCEVRLALREAGYIW